MFGQIIRIHGFILNVYRFHYWNFVERLNSWHGHRPQLTICIAHIYMITTNMQWNFWSATSVCVPHWKSSGLVHSSHRKRKYHANLWKLWPQINAISPFDIYSTFIHIQNSNADGWMMVEKYNRNDILIFVKWTMNMTR